jgi:hypothetical protein
VATIHGGQAVDVAAGGADAGFPTTARLKMWQGNFIEYRALCESIGGPAAFIWATLGAIFGNALATCRNQTGFSEFNAPRAPLTHGPIG